MGLSRWAIDHPVAVLVLMLAVIVIGVYGFAQLPVNLLPDITYPMVKVNIRWAGATPADIEQNIADVIERKLATVDDLDYLETHCTEGMYEALVNFTFGTDVDIAYQDVTAKMGTVRNQLPTDADAPIIVKADPSQLSTMDLAVTSEARDLTALRTWVDNYLQDQFTAVPGTAGSEISGGLEREIRVHVDQAALQGHGLTIADLSRVVAGENVQLLGGWVTGKQKEYVARTLAEYNSIRDLSQVMVAKDAGGHPVFLGDVARIEDSHALQRIKTVFGGQECVKLSVFKQTAANTVEVADAIKGRMAELKSLLPPDVSMAVVYDSSDYVKRSVASVRDAVLIAAVLVLLVTAFFLTGWQRIVVVTATLPLSLLGAFFVAHLLDFSINIFSLGGLVVAITVLLDNCVVVMENISRLQTEHPEEPHPIRRGVAEVGGAVVGATFTFIALFLPFLMVPGLASLLFRELILLVSVIILISLVVALTVTPALMNLFFPEGRPGAEKMGPMARLSHRTLKGIQRLYTPVLDLCLRRPWLIVGAILGVSFLGLGALRLVGSEFLPRVDDGYVMAKLKMPTGTSVAETDRVLERVEQALVDVPGIKQHFRLTGGRVWGLVTYEVGNEGEVDIELVSAHERDLDTDQWVDKYGPEITKAAMVPGARLKVMHTKMRGIRMTGEFPVEVEIKAPRSEPLEQMAEVAAQVRGQLKDVPGLAKLDVSLDVSKPEYQVLLDRERAGDLGLSAADIARTVRTFIDGITPTRYHEGGYYYDIRLKTPDGTVANRTDVEQLVLPSPGGGTFVLGDVAQVVPAVGPTQVDRYDQMRIIKVTADAAGVSTGEANAGVAKALKNYALPPGYTMRLGAAALEMKENFSALILILSMALFFAYVVLAIQFESFSLPFVIMARVPLSLVGVSLALLVTGVPLGVTVMIGVVILAGIEVNHGVVLLGYVRQLQQEGMALEEAIKTGTMVRLRPVLMTLLVGVAGLLPLALGIGEGTELLKPMAVGVIGGLVFSLLLTFLFMPSLYLLFARRQERSDKS
ncbi:MAG: efflux RND transporter permease subunit [Armatimonadota bacterium]